MTFQVPMTEPKNTDYIYIDEHNNLHLLVPIMSSENTPTLDLEQFWGLKEKSLSAVTCLENYKIDLDWDIYLLKNCKPENPLLAVKNKRLEQINTYLSILTAKTNEITNQITTPQNNAIQFPASGNEKHYLRPNLPLNRQFDHIADLLSPEEKVKYPAIVSAAEQLKAKEKAVLPTQDTPDYFELTADDLTALIKKKVIPGLLKDGPYEPAEKILSAINSLQKWDELLQQHEKTLKTLINTDHKGFKLFFASAARNRPNTINLLLKLGVAVNLKNTLHDTALLRAINNGDSQTIALLLENNADIRIRNKNKANALDLALLKHPESVKPILFKALKLTNLEQKEFLQGVKDGAYSNVISYVAKEKPEFLSEEMLDSVEPQDDLLEAIKFAEALPKGAISTTVFENLLMKAAKLSGKALDDFISSNILTNYMKAGAFALIREILFTKNSQDKSLFEVLQQHNKQALLNILNTQYETNDKSMCTRFIIYCTLNNNCDVIALLLNLGIDINTADVNNDTALNWAVYKGHLQLVTLLLESGAGLNCRGKREFNALDNAINRSSHCIIDILKKAITLGPVEQKALLSKQDNGAYSRVLIYVAGEKPELFDKLVASIAPDKLQEEMYALSAYCEEYPNATTQRIGDQVDGFLLTHKPTTAREFMDFIKSIRLNEKQYLLIRNWLFEKNGTQPAFYQELLRDDKKALVELINTQDNMGRTLLMTTKSLADATLLLELGANINTKDKEDNTALILAVKEGNVPIVTLLLEKNADITIRNLRVKNALDIAIKEMNPDIIKLLLLKGIKLPDTAQSSLFLFVDSDGDYDKKKSALVYAVKYYPELFEELVEQIETGPYQMEYHIKEFTKHLNLDPHLPITLEMTGSLYAKAIQVLCRDYYEMKGFLLSIIKNRPDGFLTLADSYFINKESTKQEKIYVKACCEYLLHLHQATKSNPDDKLAADKMDTVLKALLALLSQSKTIDVKQRIGYFANILTENKEMLCTKRDTALMTFIKALGVLAASIFGLIVGGYFAYHSFFGEKATRGAELLELLPSNETRIP